MSTAGWPGGEGMSAFSEVQRLRCGRMGVMGDIVSTMMGSDRRVLGVATPCKGRAIGLSVERFRSSVVLPGPLAASLDRCWAGSFSLSAWSPSLPRRLRQIR